MISDFDTVTRLLVAALLGSLIGFERERLLWAAGMRTHMLVAVGACLVMIVSAYGFEHVIRQDHVSLDPSRIAAQVVSGIGFLGAGAIMMRAEVVRGLTTAASIWTVAAIGLASGGGLFFAASVSTAIILAILVIMKPLETMYHARVQSCVLTITSERGALNPDDLKAHLGIHGGQIAQLVTTIDTEGLDRTTVQLIRVSRNDIRAAMGRLRDVPGIHSVVETKATAS